MLALGPNAVMQTRNKRVTPPYGHYVKYSPMSHQKLLIRYALIDTEINPVRLPTDQVPGWRCTAFHSTDYPLAAQGIVVFWCQTVPWANNAHILRRQNISGLHVLDDVKASISLLAPIYDAQFESIRASRVKAMDETPIKAGRAGHGKMQTGYFWPIYGELDEVCFPFHSSRSADFVCHALGIKPVINAVLLTDGYAAYAQYAEKTGINHARCGAHSRRGFFDALAAEPTGAAEALNRSRRCMPSRTKSAIASSSEKPSNCIA